MKNQQISPLSLVSNDVGFSIVDCPKLSEFIAEIVTTHISSVLSLAFSNLHEAAAYVERNAFSQFQPKGSRLLNKGDSIRVSREISSCGAFLIDQNDSITDEENLGYENIYWRIVRPNSLGDVGPLHADRWFWDLGHGSIPTGFRRVKVWVPLLQNDSNPSLLVLPGSQNESFTYKSQKGPDGKIRPILDDELCRSPSAAPVRIGQAIAFHDNLLHGGQASDTLRVSVEWTFCCGA